MAKTLKVRKEFREACRKLSADERSRLEEQITNDGVIRDPIVTWKGYIADGHNRYEIAHSKDFVFSETELDFGTVNDVVLWILRNQLGRRNLTPVERACFIAKLVDAKQAVDLQKKGKKDVAGKGKTEAIKEVAKEAGVSEKTVKNAVKKQKLQESLAAPVKKYLGTSDAKFPTSNELKVLSAKPVQIQINACRDVRVHDKTWSEALGIKGCPVKPPTKKGVSKSTIAFDIEQVESAWKMLLRGIDRMNKAMPDATYHLQCIELLKDAYDVYHDWQESKNG